MGGKPTTAEILIFAYTVKVTVIINIEEKLKLFTNKSRWQYW